MPHEEGARTIVGAAVGLAHALGMTACGEGVERPETLEYLESLGCDSAQGFLISRAIPARAVAAFIEKWDSGRRPRRASGDAELARHNR